MSYFVWSTSPLPRTIPEQGVGFALFSLFVWSSAFLSHLLSAEWIPFYLPLAIAPFLLWRVDRLETLKLELSLFLINLLLPIVWSLSRSYIPLLSLAALLLLASNLLVQTLVYWKKSRTASLLLLPSFFWILSLALWTLLIC